VASTANPTLFKLQLARQMAELVAARVRTLIESQTLRDALAVRSTKFGAEIFIPHYWAVYYHDGRGPVRPVNGKFLVYFANIEDDPRVRGGKDYPVRVSQIRRLRLDPDEFRRLVEEGKLIVKKSVGPTRPNRFFDKMAGRAAKIVAATAKREFRAHLKLVLKDVLRLKGTIRVSPFGG
jgi:hypothetical protein